MSAHKHPTWKRAIAGAIWAIAGLAVAWGLLSPASASDNMGGLSVGATATDFALKTPDGKEIKLSDFKGKPVVLNFWATWCPACKAEMPDMEKIYEANKDQGVVFLAVDIGESSLAVESFVQKNNITFPVVIDENSRVTSQYQIVPLPTTYFIDAKGIIRAKALSQMLPEQIKANLKTIMGGEVRG